MNPLIHAHQPQIKAFCQQFGVRRLELFGSVPRKDFKPASSDVDVVAEFEPIALGQNFDRYLGFKATLEQLLAPRVDVIELKTLRNMRLKHPIERSIVPLYAAA